MSVALKSLGNLTNHSADQALHIKGQFCGY